MTGGWQGNDGVHQAVCPPPQPSPPPSLTPTPHSIEEIKELCSRRRRGEEGGDLERGTGGWGPGALELITE